MLLFKGIDNEKKQVCSGKGVQFNGRMLAQLAQALNSILKITKRKQMKCVNVKCKHNPVSE